MSPFLPTLRTSSRRITFIASLLLGRRGVVERLGAQAVLGCVRRSRRRTGRARRRTVSAAWTTGTAVTGRALRRDAAGVREQCHLSGVLDRAGDLALLLRI